MKTPIRFLPEQTIILGILVAGIYFVAIRPLGPDFDAIPGDMRDARLNNYILEHFYRWVLGKEAAFWDASFFYPYPFTIAFSENFLGSAPVYAALRLLGFQMMAAFQVWFILGYAANYFAASHILHKLGFGPWAIAAGAFFFSFGLPMLAREGQAQLLYRFAVPYACFYLWSFHEAPAFKKAMRLLFWVVWQFYLSIYTGIFLLMLLGAMGGVLLALDLRGNAIRSLFHSWHAGLRRAWLGLSSINKITLAGSAALLLASLAALLWPYYYVSRQYGLERTWRDMSFYLPRLQSYLLADRSLLWSPIGSLIPDVPARSEQQLFLGAAVLVLIIAGIVFRFSSANRRLAQAGLMAAIILVVLTISVNQYSLYQIVSGLPGINGIRAVGRIALVWAWPVAVWMAWVLDAVPVYFSRHALPARFFVVGITALLLVESVFFQHLTYSKREAEARLDALRARIPDVTVQDPVLYLAGDAINTPWKTELDAMLVAQQLGWPTLNGFSGFVAPGYEAAKACRRLPRRIQTYMQVFGNYSESIYFDLMDRVVPVGFSDCDPRWWEKMP